MRLGEINTKADKSVDQHSWLSWQRLRNMYTHTTDCPTYWPMEGLTAGFQSAARRPPLKDWTKLITPI